MATALSTGPRKNPPHHDQLSVEQAVLGERPAVKGEDLEAVRAQDIQSGVSALQVHRRIARGSRWGAARASVRERRSAERQEVLHVSAFTTDHRRSAGDGGGHAAQLR